MKSILKKFVATLLLGTGLFFSLATSEPITEPNEASFDWNETLIDDTWMVANIFNGRTAFPIEMPIHLMLGYKDFLEDPPDDIDSGTSDDIDTVTKRRTKEAIMEIVLQQTEDMNEVPFTVSISNNETILYPEKLKENTEYLLNLDPLDDYLISQRIMPPPIVFSTKIDPKILGLWRNNDTLIISFSEPMPANLGIAQNEIDVLWEYGNDLHSIASDLNLSDFVWQMDDYLFMLAPVDFNFPGWVKVSREVKGQSGISLDGNGNGVPGEIEDDYFMFTNFIDLPICYTREDIPNPCIANNELLFN